jgi:pseudaminic acid biosynthesis-associated methylase
MEKTKLTQQLASWTAEFGKEYTDRNSLQPEQLDEILRKRYSGCSKTDIFRDVLVKHVNADARILEVGSNLGLQLSLLQNLQPALKLYGIEPMDYAIEQGRTRSKTINFLPGSAFDLPFKDNYFDVVMTNGVLIHIDPAQLPKAFAEIYRCSAKYIFFHEYYAEKAQEIEYRGSGGLMWKMNYMEAFMSQFKDVKVVESKLLPWTDSPPGQQLVDQVCLLEKNV